MVQVNPLRNPSTASGVVAGKDSDSPTPVIPLTTQHEPMLKRNLIDTAVTRGRRLVVIVGQKKALAIAVKCNRAKRRWSKLKEWRQRDWQAQGRAGPASLPGAE
jgi:exodeoxyribonuclease V alpha subunit